MKNIHKIGLATFLVSVSLSTFSASKTESFSSTNITNQTLLTIPNLDLYGIDDISYNIISSIPTPSDPYSPQSFDSLIKNLRFSFPDAPDIVINELRRVDGNELQCSGTNHMYNPTTNYYGTVKDAWIFREVEVVLCLEDMITGKFSYALAVKDHENFTNENNLTMGENRLVEGVGTALNTTPNQIVDIYNTNFSNKELTLNLLEQPGEVNNHIGSLSYGFIIEANWMGHGKRQLSLPGGIGNAVGIISDKTPSPEGDIEFIQVRFIDQQGVENTTPMMELRHLLEESYGPQPVSTPPY